MIDVLLLVYVWIFINFYACLQHTYFFKQNAYFINQLSHLFKLIGLIFIVYDILNIGPMI